MLLISSLGSSGYASRRLDEEYIGMVKSTTFPTNFGEVIRTRSETYRAFVRSIMQREIESKIDDRRTLRSVIISEHGSAARNEKGNSSKVDIHITGIQAAVQTVYNVLSNGSLKELFLEIDQRPEGETSLVYYDKDSKNPYPCRTLDSVPIYQVNSTEVQSSKRRLLNELLNEFFRVIKKINERKRGYKNIITNGGVQNFKQEEIKHYDLIEGTMTYKGDTDVYGSFKLSALRFTQNQILLEILKLLKKLLNENGAEKFIDNLPQNTKDKLLYIHDTCGTHLTYTEIIELTNLYEYFLWLYHKSQYEFERNKKTTVEIPDPQLTAENIQDLIQLTRSGIIKL